MDTSLQLYTATGVSVGQNAFAQLSNALFCTCLEPTDLPDSDAVRDAVLHKLGADADGSCLLQVAQEARYNPDLYSRRMEWCRQTIRMTFFSPQPAGSRSRVPAPASDAHMGQPSRTLKQVRSRLLRLRRRLQRKALRLL
ncbi:hypothetical protein ACFYW6_38885 [Streptomyces sp. NPDC002659]|uniref:hypothetical protein n=1 Tax=Streptomyces sp. NPDC002659 TaxID=3364656 RepID=UPI00367AC070